MPLTDAVVLKNWIPTPGGLKQSPGVAVHATSSAGKVCTLMEYAPPGGTAALFAAIGTDIYNVTSAGAIGASVYGSGALTTPYFSHTMQTSAAVSVLYLVNGSDAPVYWDGSTWTNPAITGVNENTFVTVTNHKNRLWFSVGTLLVWYLPNNAVAGAATSFDLGPLAKRGGHVVNIATWTRDGGLGPDDYIVFLTSKGEAIVYAGTDPSSASTWGLVGTYQLPPPIGNRCMLRVGADLVVMTSRGLVPMSTTMTLAESGQASAALTAKIAPTFESSATSLPTAPNWQLIEWPKERLLICNVPLVSNSASQQFAMHTETMGWCNLRLEDTGLCLGVFGSDLYMGTTNGDVWKFTGAVIDGGTGVSSDVMFAYQAPGGTKRVTMGRAVMNAPSTFVPQVYLQTDYDTTFTSTISTYSGAASPTQIAKWVVTTGYGHTFAPLVRVTSDTQLTLYRVDLIYQEGGPL
jgi:hypothetical protein